jgi:chemotaxis signal transduction protein
MTSLSPHASQTRYVVFESDEGRSLLSPSHVRAFASPRPITQVPGAAILGAAAINGDVVPVVSIGDHNGVIALCEFDDELVGVTGFQSFSIVALNDEEIATTPMLNLAGIVDRIRKQAWRTQALSLTQVTLSRSNDEDAPAPRKVRDL